MDPFTIAAIISLGVSAAQAVATGLAGQKGRRENKEEIARLEKMRASGNFLTPDEQQLLANQQTQLASSALAGQRRAEQLSAATGAAGGSAQDLATIRRETGIDQGRAEAELENQQLQFRSQQEQLRMQELNARRAKRDAETQALVEKEFGIANQAANSMGQKFGQPFGSQSRSAVPAFSQPVGDAYQFADAYQPTYQRRFPALGGSY